MYQHGCLTQPLRRKTRPVPVGDVIIGGDNPIVVQSMTTTPTTDTDATVAQIQALVEAGCPVVRITVPRQADADNLKNIRKRLKEKNISVPLVADIHFLPKLALQACDYVEKVRINPGNFADRKRFEVRAYTDQDYQNELARVAQEFVPIVLRAKERGIAMRIGTNHGSLSDRIMNRFGDTPMGMVESALEFINIARGEDYHDMICSMKSSNPFVMIHAYRLLVSEMNKRGWDYPLHLGVTEAGDGMDGRVKSAVGIASLLFDGLGDTIRVSLTEDPEKEIPVAKNIAALFSKEHTSKEAPDTELLASYWDPFAYQRRDTSVLELGDLKIGGDKPMKVRTFMKAVRSLSVTPEVECISAPTQANTLPQPVSAPLIERVAGIGAKTNPQAQGYSFAVNPYWLEDRFEKKIKQSFAGKTVYVRIEKREELELLAKIVTTYKSECSLGVEISNVNIIGLGRAVADMLASVQAKVPLHLHLKAFDDEKKQSVIVRAAGELGALLCDGIGDSIEVSHPDEVFAHELSFGILQATRLRMSRTDYISCPSCGRTLFDLQETTARIREKTNHLKGVKIAIMGCIVNGPGEMADADFGYVGSAPGKINLFVGKECVEKNIDQSFADQKLIELIKANGRWHEPSAS